MIRFIKHDVYNKLIAFIAIIHLELTINLISAHREHKVHNIVLYPDKHSWCKTLAIKQVISYPGCKSEEIDNNVCVGTCFSYSIPHTEPSDPGEVIVPYCDSCQPSDTTWHHVTLECTKNSIDSSSTPPQLVKRVQIINNCSCTSCEKSLSSTIHQTNQFNDEDDNDLIMSHVHHDVPDVLKILNRNNSETSSATGLGPTSTTMIGSNGSGSVDGINSSITNGNNNNDNGNNNSNQYDLNNGANNYDKFKDIKQILNHKIITLLKNIQENNSIHDKEQLMDLLRMIQGPNSKLNDKNIEDFVNSLHSENIELDIPRLREILIKFEHSKFYEKHRKYSNFNTYINDSGNNQNSDGMSSSSISENNGMENNGNNNNNNNNNNNGGGDNDQQQEQQHQHHLHSSNHHRHMNDNNNNNNNNNHHHQHHHIGENVVGHGHLTRGPHGALVIEPNHYHDDNNDNMNIDHDQNNKSDSHDNDDVIDDDLNHLHKHHHHHHHQQMNQIQHEKLDVNPHELKPNHAGTLLSYSGHSIDNRKP